MSMRIVPETGEMTKIAVIDPTKKYGEEGQYRTHTGTRAELGAILESQTILTWIPPGHVQPFHTHHTLHEKTVVVEGEIVAIDSESLTEDECKGMSLFDLDRFGAKIVRAGQMVIEGPGARHTVANKSDYYAFMVTEQTARIPLNEFPHDWHRDKPAT